MSFKRHFTLISCHSQLVVMPRDLCGRDHVVVTRGRVPSSPVSFRRCSRVLLFRLVIQSSLCCPVASRPVNEGACWSPGDVFPCPRFSIVYACYSPMYLGSFYVGKSKCVRFKCVVPIQIIVRSNLRDTWYLVYVTSTAIILYLCITRFLVVQQQQVL